jgi:sigma-B regulation protein RsbU (phosphoserine phosphatase)
VVRQLNEVFFANTPRNVFITVLYGLFEVDGRRLTFARAGHAPLLVARAAGSELLTPGGLAIGMANDETFATNIEEAAVELEVGDVLVFFTDGISEAMNRRGEEFGEEALVELVTAHRGESAEAILEVVREAVFDFSSSVQHDDFTMVVVKLVDNQSSRGPQRSTDRVESQPGAA